MCFKVLKITIRKENAYCDIQNENEIFYFVPLSSLKIEEREKELCAKIRVKL
jgi:hypothetical protein